MNVEEMIAAVRAGLGYPPEDKLSIGAILYFLYQRITQFRTEMGLTVESWSISSLILPVTPYQSEYIISAGDFGRPLRVAFYDQSTPWNDGPEIPMMKLQNLDKVATRSIMVSGVHVADAVAFYGVNPTNIKFAPAPTEPATYRIWYDVARAPDPALEDTPQLPPQFYDLVICAVQLDVLPLTGYPLDLMAFYERARMRQYQELRTAWTRFILTHVHKDRRRVTPFLPTGGKR